MNECFRWYSDELSLDVRDDTPNMNECCNRRSKHRLLSSHQLAPGATHVSSVGGVGGKASAKLEET